MTELPWLCWAVIHSSSRAMSVFPGDVAMLVVSIYPSEDFRRCRNPQKTSGFGIAQMGLGGFNPFAQYLSKSKWTSFQISSESSNNIFETTTVWKMILLVLQGDFQFRFVTLSVQIHYLQGFNPAAVGKLNPILHCHRVSF